MKAIAQIAHLVLPDTQVGPSQNQTCNFNPNRLNNKFKSELRYGYRPHT